MTDPPDSSHPTSFIPQTGDISTISDQDNLPLPVPGRHGHAIDGNINGLGRASGGHYLRSPTVRVLRTIDIAPNAVIKAEIAIRGPDGRWVVKVDHNDDPRTNTLFPRHWTRRRVSMEIDTAFRNSVPDFTKARAPNDPPEYWTGKASDGVVITGRYKEPGDPSQGWMSAYPVFKRR